MAIALWWPVFLICVAVLWGIARIFYMHRANGVKVLSFLSRPQTLQERSLAVLGLVVDIYLILRPVYPAIDQNIYVVAFIPQAFGLVVMTMGIALMIICQAYMGHAWRIGVPTEREDGQHVVQSGPFRFSRNPIYLGLMLFLLGTLLLLPGPLTVIVFTLSASLTNTLIKSEEAFMQKSFGQEYTDYCQRVRRWF
ncbi:methyltransferase family protein [Kordiimonas aquimaris]|uniref:methyltransferase family protein n=1 Tax=Kordiimonas aquimaris TaxID=707591 RepID=UPI0021CEE40E|nr:isoprenylcysteine carboxylmethyltransferase family protein [Kordiimonas aquimaris]